MRPHVLWAVVGSAGIVSFAPTLGHAQAAVDSARMVIVDSLQRPGDKASGSANVVVNAVKTLQVERPAALDMTHSARPKYPDLLRRYGISGTVRAFFVVDTSGRAELSSLRFFQARADVSMVPEDAINGGEASRNDLAMAAAEEFKKAVRDALPDMRFFPAQVMDHKVRQLVSQTFTFNLH